MNVTPNTVTDSPAVEVLRHYYIDADGNEVEIPFDVEVKDGQTYSGSEATQSEATVFVAEDASDHPVTFH